MAEVFISYSSLNKNIADAVCARLESDGVRCWYAPRDITLGGYFSIYAMSKYGQINLLSRSSLQAVICDED